MPVSTRSRTRGPRPKPHYVYDDDSSDSFTIRKKAVSERKSVAERKPVVKRQPVSDDDSDDDSWSGEVLAIENRGERMRLRPWLECQINKGQCTGLQWIDEKNKIVKIPWKHASRHGWRLGDACLFQRWALHSGKYRSNMKPNPKRWKANFRCALNSLADIKEVKEYSQKRGNNAFKVYQLLPLGKKASIISKMKKMTTEKTALRVCNTNLLPVTVVDLEEGEDDECEKKKHQKEIKRKPKRRQLVRQNSYPNIKKEVVDVEDQQVPDVRDDYSCQMMLDHDSYTVHKEGQGTSKKIKREEEVLESCNGGYKFNGSPTGDFRQDVLRKWPSHETPGYSGSFKDEDDEGSGVLTDEQVINEVIEMETSCSDDSDPHRFDSFSSSSPSSICEWMTDDLPHSQPTSICSTHNSPNTSPHNYYHQQHHIYSPYSTNYFINNYIQHSQLTQKQGQWNEDLIKQGPFLNGFQDDCMMPCIVQPIPSAVPETPDTPLEWQPAGLQYQDL